MGRLVVRFFWDVYDYIGRLLLLNLLAFIMCLFILPIPGVIAGLIFFMHIISSDREPNFRDFFYAFRRYYWRCLILCLFYLMASFLLIMNVRFYLTPTIIPPNLRLLSALAAGIFFWLLVIITGSIFFTFPTVIKHDLSVGKSLKRGFLFLLANPGLTFAALLGALLILVGSVLTAIGPLFFMLVFLAALANATYDTALERLEKLREQKIQPSAEEQKKPTSWHEIKAQEKKVEEQKRKTDRYSRTLRDILKPWEYK